MSALLWTLVGLPALAGTLLCLGGRRLTRIAAPLSVTVVALITVLSVLAAVRRPALELPFITGAGFGLAVDPLSAVVLPTVALVALLVLVFASTRDIAGEVSPPTRFHGLMLIFVAAVVVTVTATTLPALLFAWEVMGAMSYALIGFRRQDQDRVSAGLTAFLTTRTADLGLYGATAAALAAGTGAAFVELPAAEEGWRHVIAAGVLLAALGKAAQLPFSFWLSRAMEGPSPVSALLHSAAMVAMGGYLLLRVAPLLQVTGWAGAVTAWVGVLTALVLGVVALAQKDLKQLLAASTAAQLGFVVLGAGLGAVAGGTAHLIAHAATKALLFLVAGAWLSALGTKKLRALRGAARRWPLVGVAFTLGALSLAGVAPLALWSTKDAVLAAAREASPGLYVIGLIASALSAAYAGKALVIVWRRPRPATSLNYDTEEQGSRRIGLWEEIPLLVLAAGATVLGVLALPPVGTTLRVFLGDEGSSTASWWELVLSAVLALAVLLLVARVGVPEPRWAARWFGLERAAHVLVVAPVLSLARALARFDDHVVDRGLLHGAALVARTARGAAHVDDTHVDRAVTATSRGTSAAAVALERADTGGIDAVVRAVGRGARRLGALARRPQTGQVHQYYAQAAVFLAAALILLLLVR
ncbi:NADH-quinone oxidoreductase subunit L [Arthrobacter echini]|uniref:NADH-quinone oxidoreductase subunit L n=1 Tax=Arthrobacter echini TaxID=1529066 RepID=A0A4S5E4M8_9MICC|nr:proton-conducting transporter membrane subunit [Arthrobacter echini]THJ66446.1 NADH-quinone oxidoreductase subunit L [Arthrobacter echini]